ncbi:MAG: efflux RND transporter periplasmic adaptor subunit [Ignavibacteria bacterium]|nr:efflux RND transporter periplasmic adaptor subunit [Ignavibacteria bacterium]
MMEFKRYLLAIILISALFIGCSENENKADNEKQNEYKERTIVLSKEAIEKINLKYVTAEIKPLNGFIKVPAVIITNQNNEALVGSLIQGRVHKVFVNVGDYVKTGQVLMQIEGLEIGQLKGNYLKAKANLDFAEQEYKRQKTLFEQNVGSQKNYLTAKAEYEKALAEFNAEDKKIHSVGLSHEDIENINGNEHTSGLLTIKSPIDGIIVERNVVIGQFVETNTNAFRIINTNSVWADGQIYEKDILKISGKPTIEFFSSSIPNQTFKGKVIYIGQVVDEHTRTIKIRAEIQNTASKLKPNMFGEMLIPISSEAKGIVIPSESVIKDNNESYVFVVENDSTFRKQIVQIGVELNQMVEVIKGLKPGDKVVTKGAFFLKSEMMKESLGEEE